MKILAPFAVTPAMVLSSTLAEDEYPAWSSGSTYGLGDSVIYLHRVYESLQPGNVNNTPSTQPTWWVDGGPTNAFAMFDEKTSTVSRSASRSMSVTIKPGAWFTDLALIAFAGTSARVQMYEDDGTTLVYDQTRSMPGIAAPSFYDWFFSRSLVQTGSILFAGLPRRLNGQVVVTMYGPGSVSLGVMALGIAHDIGTTLSGCTTDIVDYSRVSFDEFGDVSITRRRRGKRVTYPVQVANADLPRILALRERQSSVMSVFIGVDGVDDLQDALLTYGLFTRFPLELQGRNYSTYSVEVQSA